MRSLLLALHASRLRVCCAPVRFHQLTDKAACRGVELSDGAVPAVLHPRPASWLVPAWCRPATALAWRLAVRRLQGLLVLGTGCRGSKACPWAM